MRVIGFLLLFVIIGLIVGYVIFGRVNDEYIDPVQIFAKHEGVAGWGMNKLYGLEEKRKNILISGAVGGIVGLFLGVLTKKRK